MCKLLNKIIILLLILLFTYCGEYNLRKDPFAVITSRYENRSSNPILLAHAGDACSILFHKRIHNILFFLPLNGYSKEEIINIANQKMIRYKNILRTGDILWNFFFFTTILTYSVEVETCDTGLVTIARHDLDYLKESARDKEKAERFKKELDLANEENNKISDKYSSLRKEYEELEKKIVDGGNSPNLEEKNSGNGVERNAKENSASSFNNSNYKNFTSSKPIVLNYKDKVLKQFIEDKQPFSILFDSGKSSISKTEMEKLKEYSENFLKDESPLGRKILLIGHSDWTGEQKQNFNLSGNRAITVSKQLVKLGVDKDKIFITFSGGLWPNNSKEKLVKHWNRRVDILLIE